MEQNGTTDEHLITCSNEIERKGKKIQAEIDKF
jgi:hypothetical protein